jgi:hypothetical protein
VLRVKLTAVEIIRRYIFYGQEKNDSGQFLVWNILNKEFSSAKNELAKSIDACI